VILKSQYNPLFEGFRFSSGIEMSNRIVMAPMTNFSSHEDGTVSDEEVEYYARRSHGPGMVITACTFATPNGKGFPGEFAADRDEMIPSLKRLAHAIQQQGAKAVLQIFHAGRSAPAALVPNGDVVSASDIASEQPGASVPRALTEDEILSIIRDFGAATRRAIEAGYDGVEIHGANGYLIHQFFSPHANRREDRWGGSLEKRMAFPLAVIEEVKRTIAEHAKHPFLIGYRFSPEEQETPGITMDDTLAFVDVLAGQGLDYLHVSLNDFWSEPRRISSSEQKTRMEWLQARVGERVPLIGVGLIHTADEALKALQSGIPLIALGRELIMEPDWVQKVKEGREEEIQTDLGRQDQQRLVIPAPLWNAIMHSPGWFPVREDVTS
jgi:2,4-dienoyl-CoA reductase-like NADH-dependent reductase (Old Yellow Enzyme family)